MAALLRGRSLLVTCQRLGGARLISSSAVRRADQTEEEVTHTGQSFAPGDYRRSRFENKSKLVNQSFAINMVAEEPVVVCEKRVVFSDSGGALGHPKVYINLDPPGVHICGYSGRKFVLKKNYDEASMGPSITYEQYLAEIEAKNRQVHG